MEVARLNNETTWDAASLMSPSRTSGSGRVLTRARPALLYLCLYLPMGFFLTLFKNLYK